MSGYGSSGPVTSPPDEVFQERFPAPSVESTVPDAPSAGGRVQMTLPAKLQEL